VIRAADPLRSLISVFYTGAATFLSSSSSFILTRAEWTPFQTHCYSENLVAPGIEPVTSSKEIYCGVEWSEVECVVLIWLWIQPSGVLFVRWSFAAKD
jgi:hypothetical protein